MFNITVTIRFTGGVLEGLEHTHTYRVSVNRWKVGQVVSKTCGGTSPYKVIGVIVVPE